MEVYGERRRGRETAIRQEAAESDKERHQGTERLTEYN